MNTTKTLVFSIVALALACNAFYAWGGIAIGIVAIVFACLAMKDVKAFASSGNVVAGKMKVANILSKIALPIAIVGIVVSVILGIVTCTCSTATTISSLY